jgi:hypothetical protein
VAFGLGIQLANFWLVPFVGFGNAILVLTVFLFQKIKSENRYKTFVSVGGIISGAALKSAFLYLFIVVLLIPFLDLSVAQASLLSSAFSIFQLFTAVLGGLLALFLSGSISRALKYPRGE